MSEATIFTIVVFSILGFLGFMGLLVWADLEAKKIKAGQPRRGLLGWLKGDPPVSALPSAGELDRLADALAERVAARVQHDRALLLELARMSEAQFAEYKAAFASAASAPAARELSHEHAAEARRRVGAS